MKTTRTSLYVLTLGLLTLCVGGAQAQGVRRGAARQARMAQAGPKGTLGTMLQQLNLTPAQKKQVEGIAKTEQEQLKSIQQNTGLSAADKTTQEKAARKTGRQQVLAVLTPDQKAHLKQLVEQRREKKGQAATETSPGTSTGTAPAPGAPAGGAAGPKTG